MDESLATLAEMEDRGEVCLGRGDVISQLDIERIPGDCPIYSSSARGNGEFGRYGKYMFDEELITWSVDGGGRPFYRPKHKFSVTNVCGYLRILAPSKWNYQFLHAAMEHQHARIVFDWLLKAHPSVIRDLYRFREISLAEQRRIAEILDTLDAAIRKTEQVIAKLQQMKQGLLHDLLTRGIDEHGHLRDPDRHPEHFKESSLGKIPKDWKVVPLGEVAEVFNGTTPSRVRPDYWSNGTVPWLSSGKVNEYNIQTASELITQSALKDNSLRLLPLGSIVIGMIGQGKTRGMSARLEIEATINQNLAGIIPSPTLIGSYAHIYLHYNYEHLRGGGRGSNQDALNCQIVSEFPIVLPPREEQEIIAYIDSSLEARIKSEKGKIDKLWKLKQGLMEDLLKGRVRVRTAETAQ